MNQIKDRKWFKSQFRGLFKACRLRREEAIFVDTDPSSPSSRLLKHQKNHARAERDINSVYAGILVASAECVPLGILQRTSFMWWLFAVACERLLPAVILSQRMQSTGIMQTLSLVTHTHG